MRDKPKSPSQPQDLKPTKSWASSTRRPMNLRRNYLDHLERLIESNNEVIEALESGRITGLGYGTGLSDPSSVRKEIVRLRQRNEESCSLLRMERAKDRLQEAHGALFPQWLPHGSGRPSEKSLDDVSSAEQEFRAARADMDLIAREIRSGLRHP